MASCFHLQSDYEPRGDQRQAIDKLVKSLCSGNKHQTLLGVTGSGKTFTMANVIAEIGKPTLVMSHNKTFQAFPPLIDTSTHKTPQAHLRQHGPSALYVSSPMT